MTLSRLTSLRHGKSGHRYAAPVEETLFSIAPTNTLNTGFHQVGRVGELQGSGKRVSKSCLQDDRQTLAICPSS